MSATFYITVDSLLKAIGVYDGWSTSDWQTSDHVENRVQCGCSSALQVEGLELIMIIERQIISADEFLEIVERPEYENRIVELVEGEIVEMPLPNPIHAALLISLSTTINVFVQENKLGRVLGGDAPFILERNPGGKDTLRGIDIAFISSERSPELLPPKPLELLPDLAVEITSPSNTADDIKKEIQQLLNAGTSLIWIVYPELRCVVVHTSKGSVTLSGDDVVTGGAILPGFEIPVSEIFCRHLSCWRSLTQFDCRSLNVQC